MGEGSHRLAVRDEVIDDVADALTLNRDVQWDRFAKLARPGDRRQLTNLRALASAVPDDEAAGGPAPAAGAMAYLGAGAFARRFTQAVIAIAAIEVVAALVLLSWNWEDYRREHGEFAAFIATRLIGLAVSACLLMSAGRRDPRTWLLGVFCLLKATLAPVHILPAVLWGIPPPESSLTLIQDLPVLSRLFGYVYVPTYVFAPTFLWAFSRECPRVHRRTWVDSLASRMVPISVAIGFAIWAVCLAMIESARAGLTASSVSLAFEAALVVLDLLGLAAVAAIALRARAASAEEVRRVALFSAGFLLYMGVAAAYNVAEVVSPGFWVSNYRPSATILLTDLLRFPGMILLWCSVLVREVPHPREVVRAYCRQLLMRPGLLGALAGAPALVLAGLVVSRQERTVGAVIAEPWVQSLFAACGILVLVALGRQQVLRRLDSWTCPEIDDQRQALASAAGALTRADSTRAVGRAVTRAANRGCGSAAVLMAVTDPETHSDVFRARGTKPPPLSRASAIVHMLEAAGGTLRVHPDDDSSVFRAAAPGRGGVGRRGSRRRHCAGSWSGRRVERRARGRPSLRRPDREERGSPVPRSPGSRSRACDGAPECDAALEGTGPRDSARARVSGVWAGGRNG